MSKSKSQSVTEVFQSYHGGEGLSVTRRNGVISLVTVWKHGTDQPQTRRLETVPTEGLFFGEGKKS